MFQAAENLKQTNVGDLAKLLQEEMLAMLTKLTKL